MTEKLKEFLSNYNSDLSNDLLLFYQFFNDPKQVLGGDEDNTLKNYYEYGRVKELLQAKDFFVFLDLCLGSYDFRRKLENEGINKNLLIKIRYIIFDFQDYKKWYIQNLETEDFREVIMGQRVIGKYVKKYKVGELICIRRHYEKCGWMYKCIPYERTLDVDDTLLLDLIRKNNFASDIFYETYEELPNLERFLIENMLGGNYDSLMYLACNSKEYLYYNNRYNKALVCSNKLLDACFSQILNQDLSYDVINKFIALLSTSINLHNLNFDESQEWLYNVVGNKKIEEYNVEFAKKVLELFQEKISQSKLIRLY